MQSRPAGWRRAFVPLAVLVVGLGGTLLVSQGWTFPGPLPNAVEASDQPAASAVETRLEVILSPALRSTGRNVYYLDAALKNPSDADVTGPVLLVVEGTGLEALRVQNADGTVDGETPYVRLLGDNETLVAGRTANVRRILFQADKRLSVPAQRDFALQYRLVIGTGDPAAGPKDRADGKKEEPASPDEAAVRKVMQVQELWTARLMAKKGVIGTATGVDDQGRPAIVVLAERAGLTEIPLTVDGVPVRILATGPIVARWQALRPPIAEPAPHRDGTGRKQPDAEDLPQLNANPRDTFTRPVPIGVSTGNRARCSAGTIACRVRNSLGKQFALSNNHVYALSNTAAVGDDILQPGRVDTGCQVNQANVIARLSAFVPIQFGTNTNNRVDAAIAEVVDDNSLGTATPDDGYGAPSAEIAAPSLLRQVKKYGRTTGLTEGRILAVNATVNVSYPGGTARFVEQIVVMGNQAGFIKAGDSGSLLVTSNGNNPCGLLFAGSLGGLFGIANRIDHVLSELNVQIDGATTSGSPSTSAGRTGRS